MVCASSPKLHVFAACLAGLSCLETRLPTENFSVLHVLTGKWKRGIIVAEQLAS